LDEGNLIGAGGSGEVCKVTLSDGEIVAVKKLWNVKKDEGNLNHGFDTVVCKFFHSLPILCKVVCTVAT